jgi:hypothetical protein
VLIFAKSTKVFFLLFEFEKKSSNKAVKCDFNL